MNTKEVYLIDVGILLTQKDDEFESYAIVYDKKYGYYDENQYNKPTLEEAILDVKKYIENGCDGTYGVVSKLVAPEDFDCDNDFLGPKSYSLDNIVYSLAKIDNQIIENFIETK